LERKRYENLQASFGGQRAQCGRLCRVGAGFGYTRNWIQDPGTPRVQANSAAINVNYFFESTTGGTGRAVATHVLQLTLTLAVGR